MVPWALPRCISLCFETVSNTVKYFRYGTHYLVAHLLGPKVIKDIPQHAWAVVHCLITHFLCAPTRENYLVAHLFNFFKMIEDHFYPLGPGEEKGIAYKFIQGKQFFCVHKKILF